MNDTSLEQTIDMKKSDGAHINLLKILEKAQENFHRVGKCVELSKLILSECCHKLEELRSQMGDLESILKEATADDNQQSLAEGNEKSDDLSHTSKSENKENQRKRLKTSHQNEEIFEIPRTYEAPGSSQDIIIITKEIQSRPQEEQDSTEKETSNRKGAQFVEDSVETALLNTEGVLSAEELRSFLYLSTDVENPVNLAKASFTKDIKGLCSQLRNFHFLLKIANDAAEKEKGFSYANKDLEVQVHNLIQAFEATMADELTVVDPLSQTHLAFRRSVSNMQRLHRFI